MVVVCLHNWLGSEHIECCVLGEEIKQLEWSDL